MSPRHLSRLFNEQAGMSLADYTNRVRIALAGELLKQTRLDIEGVAERSGFASSRQFRRAWGRYHPLTAQPGTDLGLIQAIPPVTLSGLPAFRGPPRGKGVTT